MLYPRPIERLSLLALLLLPLLLPCGGCCLWRMQNPVSKSVVESRQYVQQGVNALERRDLSEAERYCSQAIRACPDDPEARRHYADVLWEQGRPKEAIAQIEAALNHAADDTETRLRAAEMRLITRDYEGSLADVRRAIDVDPKSAAAWAMKGRILRERGELQQALADTQRSLTYEPRNRVVLRQSADLYAALQQPNKALCSLQALADTYGPGEEPQDLFVAEGFAYAALDRRYEAAKSLRAACERGPATSELLLALAEVETSAGQSLEAYRTAQQAIALAPDDPRCRAMLQQTAAAATGALGNYRR
ncbi:MAG: tetratricopeptide repeat protein [Planctomycetia bacterium]|nr:tetratricopeptide repeat protein [Planctomycetia bacterium]